MITTLVVHFLLELGATVLVVSALLVTCAALWDARPPKGPHR